MGGCHLGRCTIRQKINLIGGDFQHAKTSTLWKESKFFDWDFNSNRNALSVYVDRSIPMLLNSDRTNKKFGWMLESRSVVSGLYEYVLRNYEQLKEKSEFIITHHSDLVQKDPTFFKWAPAYGTYIDDIKQTDKTKLISMITSRKMFTSNHIKRINFAEKNIDKIDVFGRGFKEINKKESALEDYCFSVAIENDSYNGYITEKILDCFATATIPIYEGAKDVGKYFDSSGIIDFQDFNYEDLSFELYYSKKEHILNNLEMVKKYSILDDWIYNEYLVQYV